MNIKARLIFSTYGPRMHPNDWPVMLSNRTESTMIELAGNVREQTGSRSQLLHKPFLAEDLKLRQPDISLARDALG